MLLAGTGTSHGIPVISCQCKVCQSTDPHDNRKRTSAFITEGDTSVVIDTGPEFRMQALQYKLNNLDAILLTHSHADHIHGLDDVRIFTFKEPIKVYANKETIEDVRNRFDYIFKKTQKGGGKPHLDLIDAQKYNKENPLQIGKLNIIPIPLIHGKLNVLGWRIEDTAYLTDTNLIPDSSFELLHNLDHLVIDGLRRRQHCTHFNFKQAFDMAIKIGAKHSWITHICHNYSHIQLTKYLTRKLAQNKIADKTILPAYDGLFLE